MGKKVSFITVYNEKKRFPITGKGWVVQRVKFPTKKKGSQVLWTKRFKNKIIAQKFAKEKKR